MESIAIKFAVILIGLTAGLVYGESCLHIEDCVQTLCHTDHGWWLHCTDNICACAHDTLAGAACPDGSIASCHAAHGRRCENIGMVWHCIDSVCHCGH